MFPPQHSKRLRLYSAGSVKAWYPVPGCRHAYYGTLHYIGQDGYSLASSVSGGSVHYLGIYNGGIVPQAATGSAFALQVRCLQE